MKAIKYLLYICFAGILCSSTCMGDDPDFGQNEVAETGQIRFSNIKLSVNEAVTKAGGKAIDTKDYIVQIYSAKNNLLVKEFPRYSEMPEIITLEVGSYRVDALSHQVQPAEWEKPFYKGSQTFEIKKDQVTTVSAIECTLQSIRVTVELSKDLKSLVNGDESVTVTVGAGKLDFNKDDIANGRAGYFKAAEVSNILIAKFQGTVDGERIEMAESFIDLKGGAQRNVIFNLEIPSVGDMALKLKLNATCEDIALTDRIHPGKEDILPEDPSVNPGPGNMPTIVGQGFNILDEIEVQKDETKTIIVNITADHGIQNLRVKIDSETLTPDILNEVGLSSQFDLANPGNPALENALKGLGFPVSTEVVGAKTLVFDITQFTPLLGLYGLASHNFMITVIDQVGNTKSTTLALKSIAKKTE